MRCFVEVSKNHGYSITDVIRYRFRPDIRLLIMYYNHQFRLEYREYEKMEKNMKKQEKEIERKSKEVKH